MNSSYHDAFEERNKELQATRADDRRQQPMVDEVSINRDRYLFRLGRKPVHLSAVEFRIIQLLSEKPYRAYPRAEIVAVVSTETQPVTDETLDDHIKTLRDKLGIFSDYVQTVPYIGFRFKP